MTELARVFYHDEGSEAPTLFASLDIELATAMSPSIVELTIPDIRAYRFSKPSEWLLEVVKLCTDDDVVGRALYLLGLISVRNSLFQIIAHSFL